jgi:hypothetical protein
MFLAVEVKTDYPSRRLVGGRRPIGGFDRECLV